MLSNEGYLQAKCAPALSASHSVTRGSDQTTIVVTREMALPDSIPDIARTVVGNTLKLTETQVWSTVGKESEAALSIIVIAGTAEVNGKMKLESKGTGSVLHVNADIMVRIPLFGASLERSISGTVESVLHAEETIGQTWLAQNSR